MIYTLLYGTGSVRLKSQRRRERLSWYAGAMHKRSRKAPSDYNVNAARIVAIATGTEPPKPAKPAKAPGPKKNPHAVALGRRGGKVGGKRRAEALSAEERRSIAVKAARARWGMGEE